MTLLWTIAMRLYALWQRVSDALAPFVIFACVGWMLSYVEMGGTIAVEAQTSSGCPDKRILKDGGGVDAQPYIPASAKLTYAVQFPGRTMTGGTLSIAEKSRPADTSADGSPSGMVVGSTTASGDTVSFTLYPDNSGTAGARNGRSYIVTLLATTATEIVPVDLCLRVQKSAWKP